MTKEAKVKVVPVDKEKGVITADYAEVVREIIEEISGRNLETLTFSEMTKLQPIILELTKTLVDNKIDSNSLDNHKDFLKGVIKSVEDNLRRIDMLRIDLM